MTSEHQRCACLTRRQTLRAGGQGAAAVAVATLAACTPDDDTGPGQPVAPDLDGTGGSTDEPATGAGVRLPAADTSVGGATYYSSEQVIITQPSEGDFRAYAATCPHEGCSVSVTSGTTLACPCHGSTFDRATGDVLRGPATSGLTRLELEVDGQELVISG